MLWSKNSLIKLVRLVQIFYQAPSAPRKAFVFKHMVTQIVYFAHIRTLDSPSLFRFTAVIMVVSFDEDKVSFVVDKSAYDCHGLNAGYVLRQHRYDAEANTGSQDMRDEWARYIGPVAGFGVCNPLDGNFVSLIFPLCKPERIRLIAYIAECKFLSHGRVHKLNMIGGFLHDNVLELSTKASV
jgi:hypothetical protein